MDVLYPTIEIIDGISYRVNYSDDYNVLKDAETTPYIEFDEEEQVECSGEVIEDEKADAEVECLDDGYYLIQLHVPKDYHAVIIGPRGTTRQRLEKETKAQIDVPKVNETGKVEIKGKTKVGVLAACRRIKAMIGTVRSRAGFTHFISIPMTSPEIIKNFQTFKEQVLNTCGKCSGINEDLFQNPAKLHLTIQMLQLIDNKERELAYNVMIACKEDIALKVRVCGLEVMNDDPTDVRVLYGKVEDPSGGLLQELADRIVDYCVDARLIEKDKSNVKLHMTLMSSRFYLNKNSHPEDHRHRGSKKKKYYSFDASKILELYKQYDFGEIELNKIHLSQRHTKTESGYYIPSCQLTFY